MQFIKFVLSSVVVVGFAFAKAQSPKSPSIQQYTGYYNFTYDDSKGVIELEVKSLDKEFLYVHSLTTGLGSNDIGIDRGQLGDGVVVKWVKSGNKLLLVQPNLGYRASSDNALERRSVTQAFAQSVLYGFTIKSTKDGVHTIDFTPFLLEDTHGIIEKLKSQKEGTYKIDTSRSALWMERTKSFPKNSEFEAMLTFTGTPTGRNLRSVAPDASSVSVIQHISFVELPDNAYQPRVFHPQSGSFYTSYLDYSAPVYEPIKKRFITRHRLYKKDPNAARSEAVKPIIYYLDNGTPEPIRSALLEGAQWWNQAFEAAGYINAFQVKILPDDADPMDLRYNVIQWVHRSTRGWSYGGSITDPRTGEILKGHVSLGSLRIRQDFMIAQGLLKEPFKNSDVNHDPMMQLALARIRQLSAHEVGHTLGFAHNFAASAQANSSVMDYPHPYVKLVNDTVDISNAYDTGIGDWDKLTVTYSYGNPVGAQTEAAFLKETLDTATQQNFKFITDSDARDASGSHATAHLWDNGMDAVEELERIMDVRRVAMNQFGIHNIRNGEPLSVLEDVFVPVYFLHRYQVEAAIKSIGGMEYEYATKDTGAIKTHSYLIKAAQQQALKAVLKTITPQELAVPDGVRGLFPPRAYGYNRDRESFTSGSGVAFDPIAIATSAVQNTLGMLIEPERFNRIAMAHATGDSQLELDTVTDMLLATGFKDAKPVNAYEYALSGMIKEQLVLSFIQLHASKVSSTQVKAAALAVLQQILKESQKSKDPVMKHVFIVITGYLNHPEIEIPQLKIRVPDGSPIGCGI